MEKEYKEKPIEEVAPSPAEKFFVGDEIKQQKLFANLPDTRADFAISQPIAYGISHTMKKLTPDTVNAIVKYKGLTTEEQRGKYGLKLQLATNFLKEKSSEEELTKYLLKLKDGTTIQAYCSLWQYASKQGSTFFNSVKLNKIMETTLNRPRSGYFTQKMKREFTERLLLLGGVKIFIDPRGNKRGIGGFINLLDVMGTFNKKGDVLLNLTGELAPSYNKQLLRGEPYRAILRLDAQKDKNERIVFLYYLQTRLNQLRHYEITMPRQDLIKWAGLEKTDTANKTVASRRLKEALDRFIEIGGIKEYAPKEITNDNDLRITIYSVFEKEAPKIDTTELVN
jgi:hypothetical protein